MDKRGWPPNQIDEIDAHYYFELLGYREKLKDPKIQRKKARERTPVVPIDAVF